MGSRHVTAGRDHKNERSGEYSQDISNVDSLFSFLILNCHLAASPNVIVTKMQHSNEGYNAIRRNAPKTATFL